MTRESALTFAETGRFSQLRAFAGDVLYTEGMPAPHLYVVKEGVVDLYLVREEKRTVVETLGPGQCFGIEPHLPMLQARVHNAAARTYCELYVVDAGTVGQAIAAAPQLAQGLLDTLSERLADARELIARRVNFQPELLMYAQMLQLVGQAELGRGTASVGTRAHGRGRHGHAGGHGHGGAPGAGLARPLLQDVLNHARVLFGHSDRHVRGCLGKLLNLHLIRIEDEHGVGKQVLYSPADIVSQVRKVIGNDADAERQSHQYVTLDEFAALVDVDRGVLLKKLAAGEFAEDVFTFRRAEILRVLDTKGRRYFAERKLKSPADFADIGDIEFADARSIFEAVAKVDSFDLAKVLHGLGEGDARHKVLAALSARRRDEVERELADMANVDPVEAQRLGAALIQQVKSAMLQKAA